MGENLRIWHPSIEEVIDKIVDALGETK